MLMNMQASLHCQVGIKSAAFHKNKIWYIHKEPHLAFCLSTKFLHQQIAWQYLFSSNGSFYSSC